MTALRHAFGAAVVLASFANTHAADADPKDDESMSFVRDTQVGPAAHVDKGGPLLWPGELLIGVGILGTGTSIGLFTAANAADATAIAKGTVSGKPGALTCDPKALSLQCKDVQASVDKHNAYGNAAIGTLITGGATLAGGIVYLAVMLSGTKSDDPKKAAFAPVIVPVFSSDFRGAAIGGRF